MTFATMEDAVKKMGKISDFQNTYSNLEIIHRNPENMLIVCKAKGNDRKDWALKIYQVSDEDPHCAECLMNDHQNQLRANSQYVLKTHKGFYNKEKTLMFLPNEFAPSTLYQLLLKEPIRLKEFINITTQLVKGLDYIHKCDIAHGDITLKNIFVVNDCYKFGDFGSYTLGTPNYRHISQIRADTILKAANIKDVWTALYKLSRVFSKEDRKRFDIYSLGCVFYDIICHNTDADSKRIIFSRNGSYQNEWFGLSDVDKDNLKKTLKKFTKENQQYNKKIYTLITSAMCQSSIDKTKKIRDVINQ